MCVCVCVCAYFLFIFSLCGRFASKDDHEKNVWPKKIKNKNKKWDQKMGGVKVRKIYTHLYVALERERAVGLDTNKWRRWKSVGENTL